MHYLPPASLILRTWLAQGAASMLMVLAPRLVLLLLGLLLVGLASFPPLLGLLFSC